MSISRWFDVNLYSLIYFRFISNEFLVNTSWKVYSKILLSMTLILSRFDVDMTSIWRKLWFFDQITYHSLFKNLFIDIGWSKVSFFPFFPSFFGDYFERSSIPFFALVVENSGSITEQLNNADNERRKLFRGCIGESQGKYLSDIEGGREAQVERETVIRCIGTWLWSSGLDGIYPNFSLVAAAFRDISRGRSMKMTTSVPFSR